MWTGFRIEWMNVLKKTEKTSNQQVVEADKRVTRTYAPLFIL